MNLFCFAAQTQAHTRNIIAIKKMQFTGKQKQTKQPNETIHTVYGMET